jgi:hypothetical protein
MTTSYRFPLVLFLIFCLLSFYSFGTAMMDYFMLYPSRFFVGENEFVQYHQFLESTIMPISVFPFLAIIVMNILIFWFRSPYVSKKLLWISCACLIIDLLSTVLIQAPWNFELSEGKNIELMEKITNTNWLRVILESSQVIVVFLMLKQFTFAIISTQVMTDVARQN